MLCSGFRHALAIASALFAAACSARPTQISSSRTGAFEAALAAAPGTGATAFFLGWSFHGAGDDRQAISAWRRAAYVDPTIVPAHLALADIYIELSQPALAIQALRAGLTALPESPELRDRLSRLERR